MLFLNIIFLFLLSVVPIHLLASESPLQKTLSRQQSRNGSPVVELRLSTAQEEYTSVLYYDFPGSKNVTLMRERRSLPIQCEPNVEQNDATISPANSTSLPEESKLDKMMNSSISVNLSQSTERFNIIKQELDALKALVTSISQRLPMTRENPSK